MGIATSCSQEYFIMNSCFVVSLSILGVLGTAFAWPQKRFSSQQHTMYKRRPLHMPETCNFEAFESCQPKPNQTPERVFGINLYELEDIEEMCIEFKATYACAVEHGCDEHEGIVILKNKLVSDSRMDCVIGI